jgi:hypothetical protein
LTERQRDLLAKLHATLRGLREPDIEYGNNDIVRCPAWRVLRESTAEELRSFGWPVARVQPFMEVEPDVWHRPLAVAGHVVKVSSDGGDRQK